MLLKIMTEIGGFKLGASPSKLILANFTEKTSGESLEYGFSPWLYNCPDAIKEPKSLSESKDVIAKMTFIEMATINSGIANTIIMNDLLV
jgi:hypothetical protein